MKFNIDSPVFTFMGTFADYVLLNCIFLISCIPIITIGPAVTALVSVTMKDARGDQPSIIHDYKDAFVQNFKSSFIISIGYFVVGAILLFSYVFWFQVSSPAAMVVLVILTLAGIVYLSSLLYVFALNARFENTIRQTIKNSVLLAITNLRQTVFLFLILIVAATLLYTTAIFRVFMLIFGFAFLFYCLSYPIVRVFSPYDSPEMQE